MVTADEDRVAVGVDADGGALALEQAGELAALGAKYGPPVVGAALACGQGFGAGVDASQERPLVAGGREQPGVGGRQAWVA